MPPESLVKILDFGLSKPIESSLSKREDTPSRDDGESSLTLPGTLVGTPEYMSPEQTKGMRVDFRADQFALGAILYEMATGVSAFRRETLPLTLAAVGETIRSGLASFRAVVPREMGKVVERLLSKRREDRYPAMVDVADALETIGRSPWNRKVASSALRLVGTLVGFLA